MKHLLDEELLSGPHEVITGLRPQRRARCVVDLAEAEAAASLLCQTWGGENNPIVPMHDGKPSSYLNTQLIAGEIDGFTCSEVAGEPPATLDFLENLGSWDFPAVLIAAHEKTDDFRPLEVVELDDDDPWKLSYLGTLGALPEKLDEDLCESAGVEELIFSKVVPVERVQTSGSLDDLLYRLSDRTKITPRQFSSLHLASGSSPNTGFLGTDPIIPNQWQDATAAGPNIVVVMSPGSLDDFALLWNLRAVWGDSRPMPIGIPRNQIDAAALGRLRQPGTTTFFGFSGGRSYLVSESVSADELSEMAKRSHGVKVARPSDLVRIGSASSRVNTQILTWTDGAARLPPLSDADRKVLSIAAHSRPTLSLSVSVPEFPIPIVGPLRGQFSSGFHGGSAQVSVPGLQSSETVAVQWPTSWTTLTASALTHGLDVRESQPGIAVASLIRAVGSIDGLRYLADARLVRLLYDLAERSGMSWWKSRWNRLEKQLKAEGKTEAEISELSERMERDTPAIAPADEGRQLSYSKFRDCFVSTKATDRWLAWAIEKRIVVKGFELKCPHCQASFWLPVQDIAPPHVCPGCARHIVHPFRSDLMTFKYRLGEVVRRCLEVDALGHALAIRWLTELFGDRGFVGAHPGVEFMRDGRVVAEVDVLLLFRDGSMVPVEVKRQAHAFGHSAVAQLDAISDALGAPFDVMCVLDAADQCEDVASFKKTIPDRPRFLLTMDQLTTGHVFWAMGANPFENARDADAAKRREIWLSMVSAIGDGSTDLTKFTVDQWRRESGNGVN